MLDGYFDRISTAFHLVFAHGHIRLCPSVKKPTDISNIEETKCGLVQRFSTVLNYALLATWVVTCATVGCGKNLQKPTIETRVFQHGKEIVIFDIIKDGNGGIFAASLSRTGSGLLLKRKTRDPTLYAPDGSIILLRPGLTEILSCSREGMKRMTIETSQLPKQLSYVWIEQLFSERSQSKTEM